MAIEDAIEALSRHWDDVELHLGPEQLRELRRLVAALDGPDRDDAMAGMADLLDRTLPAGHQVIQALYQGDLCLSATLDWSAVVAGLRVELAGGPAAAPVPEAGLRPGESILRRVADRVLKAAALTADQVRERGGDPDDPGLIRLERPDGRAQWPAFQFQPDGGPRPVIRAVNDLLDASADPFAAADWWLSRNSWLGDRPSALIGQVPDDHLVRAARAVGSED